MRVRVGLCSLPVWGLLCATLCTALSTESTVASLQEFRKSPPIPLNYSKISAPHYLLPNIFNLLFAMASDPAVNEVAALTLFFVPPSTDGTMGNILSLYLEARLCAKAAGLHFVSVDSSFVGLGSEGLSQDQNRFYSYLDSVVYNPNAKNISVVKEVPAICPCTFRCHATDLALVTRKESSFHIRDILYPAYAKRFEEMKLINNNRLFEKSERPIWKAQLRHNASDLPHLPEVAIQYRCSDNTLPGYGLLAWTAFLRHIPKNTSHIYVITEDRHFRTKGSRVDICDHIIQKLSDFLFNHFSSASVVVLRGGNAFDDATRFAMAPITICSASTFCFWPAVSSKTESHFPITKLMYSESGTVEKTPEFHWLTNPDEILISLIQAEVSMESIMKMLKKGQIIVNDEVVAGADKGTHSTRPMNKVAPVYGPNAKKNSLPKGDAKIPENDEKTSVLQPSHFWIALPFFVVAVLLVYRKKYSHD